MSKLFALFCILSFSVVAFAQFPPLPHFPKDPSSGGLPKDFQPPRRGHQIPEDLRVPSEQELIRRIREKENRGGQNIPGSDNRLFIDKLTKDAKVELNSRFRQRLAAVATAMSEQISTKNFDRLNFGDKTKRLTDGRIDVSVEVNTDGRVQLALVTAFPLNFEKRKFAEDAVRMVHSTSPYKITLSEPKITVELTFYFDDAGKFKVQPKILEPKLK